MKPKLVILNGPLGIGKSTLARRYGEDHPLTLVLDIDDVRAMLSHWREEQEDSGLLSKLIALDMARVNLQAGHDVVVPQILQDADLADHFWQLAKDCGANYYEILLFADKDEALSRFIERGQREGHPTGFRAGGLIDRGGREKKLAEMHDRMIAVAISRPHVIKIEPIHGDIDGTYAALLEALA